MRMIAIGEVMAELRRAEDGSFGVGYAGDTYNTAVYCVRGLGVAQSVGFFSRVGADPLSAELIRVAAAEDLDVTHLARDKTRNIGVYAVATDETGERSFSYWRDQSAARQLFSHDEAVHHLPQAEIYYLSGISLAIMEPSARRRLMDYLKQIVASGSADVAFDSNYRPKLWENAATAREVMGEMWDIATIALPSIDDEMALFEDATEDAVIARFARKAWKACAIKRGVRGPVSLTLASDQMPIFAPAQKVVDTTAAGDSFNGGYLSALLSGQDEAACLLKGHETASYVVGVYGAIAPRA